MKTLKQVKQTYSNPRTFGTNSLTYTMTRDGRHIVTHRMSAGETANDMPEVYRHDTVEEARQTWARLTASLKSRGYTTLAK